MKPDALKTTRALLAGALSLVALPARAVVLLPGDNLPLPGTTVAAEPQLAGEVLVDELIPFSVSDDSITGTVQQRIVRSLVDGTLDFYWRVFNDQESQGAVGSLRLVNFFSPEYNANYRTDGLGDTAPDSAHRFPAPDESADLNFVFVTGVMPGHSSYFLLLDTTATSYAPTALYDLTDTGVGPITPLYTAYSPAPSVPEPGTVGLVGVGVAVLAWRRRRAS